MISLCIWLNRLPNWLRTNLGCCQAGVRRQAERSPALLEQIDGASRRPLWPLTLMRYLLSKMTAFKGADGPAAESVWMSVRGSDWSNWLNRVNGAASSEPGVLDKTFWGMCGKYFLNTYYYNIILILISDHVVLKRKPFTLSAQRLTDFVCQMTFSPFSIFVCLFVCLQSPLCSTWNSMWVKTLFGWMLVLAEVQTTDALYTNESIHFNNRSPIWHRGPSSTLHPGRGSHSCFQTAVHYEINCSDLMWPGDKGKTLC